MKFRILIYIASILILSTALVFIHKQFLIEQWMRISLSKQNIVVAFTTTPYRINDLRKNIDLILAQNAPISKIYLSIPYKFKRDNLEYVIPKWLQDNDKITILRTKDYGPATKLLGLLEQVDLPPNTIIVTIDDDISYPPNLVLQLAYKATQFPNTAIGIVGSMVDPSEPILGLRKIFKSDAQVTVLHGFAAIAYRRSFFDPTIFDIVNTPKECINSDDLYLSFYLAKHNIPRQVLKNEYITSCSIGWDNPINTSDNALHRLVPKQYDKHQSCIAYMKAIDPNVDF